MRSLPRVESLPKAVRQPVDPDVMSLATDIVTEVRSNGETAIRRYSEHFDDLTPDDQIVYERGDLWKALDRIAPEERQALERVASRIRHFAEAQREALIDVDVEVTGGRAGHRWVPVSTVGAYAPGGRYPLPSSVLMTVIPAWVAGVDTVWVASPRPTDVIMAAAAIAGADGLLAIGGAQAIAALAFGTLSPVCDLIVGPGNKYVTAAKKLVFGEVGIWPGPARSSSSQMRMQIPRWWPQTCSPRRSTTSMRYPCWSRQAFASTTTSTTRSHCSWPTCLLRRWPDRP
jgi:phosphoribosyl-ATP pyrophosphohydrolase/phosphoribosyl-AMP cyclohydrolase/histidinol dehydrogenase